MKDYDPHFLSFGISKQISKNVIDLFRFKVVYMLWLKFVFLFSFVSEYHYESETKENKN